MVVTWYVQQYAATATTPSPSSEQSATAGEAGQTSHDGGKACAAGEVLRTSQHIFPADFPLIHDHTLSSRSTFAVWQAAGISILLPTACHRRCSYISKFKHSVTSGFIPSHVNAQGIASLCQRRSHISCAALRRTAYPLSSGGSLNNSSLQLVVALDPALLRIVSYVTHHAAVLSSPPFPSAPKIHYVTGRCSVQQLSLYFHCCPPFYAQFDYRAMFAVVMLLTLLPIGVDWATS